MPTVTLREVTAENWRAIALLWHTLPHEERWVMPNAHSILEAFYDPENLFSRAIFHDDTPVGYVLFGVDLETTEWWAIRLMIAKHQQRKGYARAALQAVIAFLQGRTDTLYVSFDPLNEAARHLYTSLGFADTGRVEEDEVIYQLAFPSLRCPR